MIVGYADRNTAPVGRPLHNAVALLRGGRIVSRHFKTLLPTYDVFDESRYFEPGPLSEPNQLVHVAGVPMGLSICEDLWNDERLIPRRLYHANDPSGQRRRPVLARSQPDAASGTCFSVARVDPEYGPSRTHMVGGLLSR